jgi:hypothetical protein
LKISTPKEAIENLFEPNLENTVCNYDNITDRLYIVADNGDAAGAYAIVWLFEKGNYKTRIVLINF